VRLPDGIDGLGAGSVNRQCFEPADFELYFAVRPERDALTAEEVDQPDHKTLRALITITTSLGTASAVLAWRLLS
jgi:hypothetical protein